MEINKILLVTRNYRGTNEINYLLTLEDFKKKFVNEDAVHTFFSSGNLEKDWVEFTNALDADGEAEWAVWNNDTWFCKRASSLGDIKRFLEGEYNDSASDMVTRNMTSEDELEQLIETYQDWYWEFDPEESSPSIIKDLKSIKVLKNLLKRKQHYEDLNKLFN